MSGSARDSRFSVVEVAVGAVFAAIIMVCAIGIAGSSVATPACTAAQVADSATAGRAVAPAVPVAGGVAAPILEGWEARARELAAIEAKKAADAVVAGLPPPKPSRLSLEQWLYVLGLVGGGTAAAIKSARASDGSTAERVAVGVGQAIKAAVPGADDAVVASRLTEGLPGAGSVTPEEVAAGATAKPK